MPHLARFIDRIVGGGRRSVAVGLVLAGALVAILAFGQRLANGDYHRAAVTEVARLGPASRLLTDMLNADAAVQGYVTTLDPSRLASYQSSVGAFERDVDGQIRASGDAPAVQAQLRRLEGLATQWQDRVARALPLAAVGHTVDALRMVRGALTPTMRAHARLMTVLEARRLGALRDADRWSDVVLGVSIAAAVLASLALTLVFRRRPAGGALPA